MKPVVALLVGGGLLAAGGLAIAASESGSESNRQIWLIKGKRYAIDIRMTGPGWSPDMFPGFCNFSTPVLLPAGVNPASQTYNTEVQFEADWCIDNIHWDVPPNIAVSEV